PTFLRHSWALVSRSLLLPHQLVHLRDEFFDGVHALLEIGLLLLGQLQLDNPLDAVGAQYDGNAHIVTAHAVFTITVRSARNETLLVANHGFDHLGARSRRSIVGAAGLQQVDNFFAAVPRSLNN